MALVKQFRAFQSTSFNPGTYFLLYGTAASTGGSSGNLSYSSVFYTVPSGKVAKVIINNLDFYLNNQAYGYDQSAGGLSFASDLSSKFLWQQSYNTIASFNIGSLSYNYSSTQSISTRSFGNINYFNGGLVYYSMFGAGMVWNRISYNMRPLDNNVVRGMITSFDQNPLSLAYFSKSGTAPFNGVTTVTGINQHPSQSFTPNTPVVSQYEHQNLKRVMTISSGETVGVNISFSFIFSVSVVSAGTVAPATTRAFMVARQNVTFAMDVLVIEDNQP